jgi:hypothetical protein
MPTTSVREIEHKRRMSVGLDHNSDPWTRDLGIGEAGFPLRPGRRNMRVKLCSRCPYTPRDLAGHYDPQGDLHVCATCDAEQGANTNYRPHKTPRRQQCVTALNFPGTAQPCVARSATDNLASSGTIRAEPPSVQRSALSTSRHVCETTAAGYTPPDNGRRDNRVASRCGDADRHPREIGGADGDICFTLGDAT